MDWKEFDKQWLALGQRMKLHGELLYPEWQWILSLRDSNFYTWIRDVMALKVRRIAFDEDEEGYKYFVSKHGIVIDIGEAFLLEYLAIPDEEKLVVIKDVLHGAIKKAMPMMPGQIYQSYNPYYGLPDGRHEWRRNERHA